MRQCRFGRTGEKKVRCNRGLSIHFSVSPLFLMKMRKQGPARECCKKTGPPTILVFLNTRRQIIWCRLRCSNVYTETDIPKYLNAVPGIDRSLRPQRDTGILNQNGIERQTGNVPGIVVGARSIPALEGLWEMWKHVHYTWYIVS